MLVHLQDDNITVSVFVTFVNNTHQRYDDDDDDDYGQSESVPPRWLPVANISVHVKRVETDYNTTSSYKRKLCQFSLFLPRDATQ